MEPTYAHTCVKGIKLAAGELSDSTEEEEVEAMEMYARLAEAEDPRDFEQMLQEGGVEVDWISGYVNKQGQEGQDKNTGE